MAVDPVAPVEEVASAGPENLAATVSADPADTPESPSRARAGSAPPLDLGNMFWSVLLNRLRSLLGLKPKVRCPTCGK
jgi:hypothetical protein